MWSEATHFSTMYERKPNQGENPTSLQIYSLSDLHQRKRTMV